METVCTLRLLSCRATTELVCCQGFRPSIREGFTLQVNDDIELDMKLEIGAASEV